MKRWLASLSILAISAAFAPAAIAQQAPPPGSQPGAQAPAATAAQPSEKELRTFAAAALEVREIGTEWQPRMAEATSEEQAAEIQEQARDQMVEAVEEKGLTVERYNEITTHLQADPQLAEQVMSYMQQAQ